MSEQRILASDSFDRFIGRVPAAFAVTRGPEHTLVYANAAFRNLTPLDRESIRARPISDAFPARDASELIGLLDEAYRTGDVVRNRRVLSLDEDALLLSCTVWPDPDDRGQAEHLVIELRAATQDEISLGLQREVAERLLLSALREQDATTLAEESAQGASFLATETKRISESLDEGATLTAMSGMSLPSPARWCIVDILEENQSMRRLAILHPDPEKQRLLDGVNGRWEPAVEDSFGLPAVMQNGQSGAKESDGDAALADPEKERALVDVLRTLGIGRLLTVPLTARDRLIGAITFVSGDPSWSATPRELALAEDLAGRAAMALDRARAYGEAIALRVRAEAASQAKSAFLGMMSHELRTPLNAIGGYADLIDMELHGPVTEAQHVNLNRIKVNQRYLTGLINDLLNLTRLTGGIQEYKIADVVACNVLADGVALVAPLIEQKGLQYDGITCAPDIALRADREKVIQILVNLLSNAIKFTPHGGSMRIDCEAGNDLVTMHIVDTGIGIAPERCDDIFEPFVQVRRGSTGPEDGVGLGLAISRSLARDMRGELTVESRLGEGSRFTLTLPRASAAARVPDAPGLVLSKR